LTILAEKQQKFSESFSLLGYLFKSLKTLKTMEKQETLNKIFNNDPLGILGEKTLPVEARDLLIQLIGHILNNKEIYQTLEQYLLCEDQLQYLKLNPDSYIFNEIEEYIADKILEDNEIQIKQ
jgi:hypothetical protein